MSQLRERLSGLAASRRHLVIDLNQVTFIDAAGLSALVAEANRAAAHGTAPACTWSAPARRFSNCSASPP